MTFNVKFCERMSALDVEFTDDDLREIADAMPPATGDRYAAETMGLLNG